MLTLAGLSVLFGVMTFFARKNVMLKCAAAGAYLKKMAIEHPS